MGLEVLLAPAALTLHGSVVELHQAAREDLSAQLLLDRLELKGARHYPVAHRLARNQETFALEDRLLAIQRKVIAVLLHQDPCKQGGPSLHAFEDSDGRGCHERLDRAFVSTRALCPYTAR
jgi:hypothetical protein